MTYEGKRKKLRVKVHLLGIRFWVFVCTLLVYLIIKGTIFSQLFNIVIWDSNLWVWVKFEQFHTQKK